MASLIRSKDTIDLATLVREWQAQHSERQPDGPIDEAGEKSAVARLTTALITLFRELVLCLSNERQFPRDIFLSLDRSRSCLSLWSDGHGVAGGSLDDRFQRSAKLRHATMKILSHLSSTLVDRLAPVAQIANHKAKGLCDQVSNILEEVSFSHVATDSSSDSTSESSNGDVVEVAEDLKTDVECLIELDQMLRDPAMDPEPEATEADVSLSLWEPHQVFVDKIEHRFPKAETKLSLLLGMVNYERYRRCLGERDCNQQHAEQHVEVTTGSEFHDSGLGTSLNPASSYAETIMSYRDGNRSIRIPPLPEQAKRGEPFPCVACGLSVPITNNSQWKRHLYLDLQPYVCLDPSCQHSNSAFSNRANWLQHLALDHGMDPSWEVVKCPLCAADIGPGKISITTHLGRHLEEISLSALPAAPESETNSEVSDVDSDMGHGVNQVDDGLKPLPTTKPVEPRVELLDSRRGKDHDAVSTADTAEGETTRIYTTRDPIRKPAQQREASYGPGIRYLGIDEIDTDSGEEGATRTYSAPSRHPSDPSNRGARSGGTGYMWICSNCGKDSRSSVGGACMGCGFSYTKETSRAVQPPHPDGGSSKQQEKPLQDWPEIRTQHQDEPGHPPPGPAKEDEEKIQLRAEVAALRALVDKQEAAEKQREAEGRRREHNEKGLRPRTVEDPEMARLRDQIAVYKAIEEERKAAEKQKVTEAQIRKDAEEAFQRRMHEMMAAQEEAKKEIEKAKAEAIKAAREQLEAERKGDEERARKHAEEMAQAEEMARLRFEAEMKASEEQWRMEEAGAEALGWDKLKEKARRAVPPLRCVYRDCYRTFSRHSNLLKHYKMYHAYTDKPGADSFHEAEARRRFDAAAEVNKEPPGPERRDTEHADPSAQNKGPIPPFEPRGPQRLMTAPKPHTCPDCGKKFSQRANLRTHYANFHKAAGRLRSGPRAKKSPTPLSVQRVEPNFGWAPSSPETAESLTMVVAESSKAQRESGTTPQVPKEKLWEWADSQSTPEKPPDVENQTGPESPRETELSFLDTAEALVRLATQEHPVEPRVVGDDKPGGGSRRLPKDGVQRPLPSLKLKTFPHPLPPIESTPQLPPPRYLFEKTGTSPKTASSSTEMHEDTGGQRKFTCTIPFCWANGIGYDSQESLELHHQSAHQGSRPAVGVFPSLSIPPPAYTASSASDGKVPPLRASDDRPPPAQGQGQVQEQDPQTGQWVPVQAWAPKLGWATRDTCENDNGRGE